MVKNGAATRSRRKWDLGVHDAISRKVSLRLAACALTLAAASILYPSRALAADKITVGVLPITDVAPVYLGVQKGFFTRQNLDITL
jgi:NitT/TauT family transport system substrate-binding protein